MTAVLGPAEFLIENGTITKLSGPTERRKGAGSETVRQGSVYHNINFRARSPNDKREAQFSRVNSAHTSLR